MYRSFPTNGTITKDRWIKLLTAFVLCSIHIVNKHRRMNWWPEHLILFFMFEEFDLHRLRRLVRRFQTFRSSMLLKERRELFIVSTMLFESINSPRMEILKWTQTCRDTLEFKSMSTWFTLKISRGKHVINILCNGTFGNIGMVVHWLKVNSSMRIEGC